MNYGIVEEPCTGLCVLHELIIYIVEDWLKVVVPHLSPK